MQIDSRKTLLSLASSGILSLSLSPIAFADDAIGIKTPPATETVSPPVPNDAAPPAADAAPPAASNVTPPVKVEKNSAGNAFANSFTNGFGSDTAAAKPKAAVQTKVQAKPQTQPKPAASAPHDPYGAYRRGYGTNSTTKTYNNYGGLNVRTNGFANNSSFQSGNDARAGSGRMPPIQFSRPAFGNVRGASTIGSDILKSQERQGSFGGIGNQYKRGDWVYFPSFASTQLFTRSFGFFFACAAVALRRLFCASLKITRTK